MENIVDSGASEALNCAFFHEPSFDLVRVGIRELIDEVQHNGALVDTASQGFHVDLVQFSLLLGQELVDLLAEVRNALEDVGAQDLVHASGEVPYAQLVRVGRINGVLLKELPLHLNRILYAHALVDLLLGPTLHPVITQLQRIYFALKEVKGVSSLVH